MTAQAYKIGGTMKPELKFGRRVITEKGEGAVYIQKHLAGGHSVMIGNKYVHRDYVKPDLTASPMNGDEVEGYTDRKIGIGRYVGIMADGRHLIETEMGSFLFCDSVRHPQPSKRERIKELLRKRESFSRDIVFDDEFVDEIMKITEDE